MEVTPKRILRTSDYGRRRYYRMATDSEIQFIKSCLQIAVRKLPDGRAEWHSNHFRIEHPVCTGDKMIDIMFDHPKRDRRIGRVRFLVVRHCGEPGEDCLDHDEPLNVVYDPLEGGLIVEKIEIAA